MSKQKLAAVATTIALLGLAGAASAQTPAQGQYGGGGGVAGGGGGGGAGEAEGGGALPFTGFQAGLVLLGGAGIAAAGLAVRRLGRSQKN
jgi:hypothetical protein